jgi:hypothetical protein
MGLKSKYGISLGGFGVNRLCTLVALGSSSDSDPEPDPYRIGLPARDGAGVWTLARSALIDSLSRAIFLVDGGGGMLTSSSGDESAGSRMGIGLKDGAEGVSQGMLGS